MKVIMKDVITAYCPCCENVQRMLSYKSISGELITTADGSAEAYVCDNCGAEVYVANQYEEL